MRRRPARIAGGETAGRLCCVFNPVHAPLAVTAMALAACFSQRQFHRLTVKVTGETPGAHHRRLRLDRAAWLLLTGRATILEIALEPVGRVTRLRGCGESAGADGRNHDWRRQETPARSLFSGWAALARSITASAEGSG